MEKRPKTRAARRDKRVRIGKAIEGTKGKDVAEKEQTIPVYDMKGKKLSDFAVDTGVFTGEVNKAALYQALVMYNANSRQGNAATKTRGDVSGGGKKPFRQKGTGRARAGSTRSPLWRHGGTIHGPQVRDYSYSIPKTIKRLAFMSSINSKFNDKKIKCVDSVEVKEPKTKIMASMLAALKLSGKTLLVLADSNKDVLRASKNIAKLNVKNYKDVNTMDFLLCEDVVISKQALEKLPERI